MATKPKAKPSKPSTKSKAKPTTKPSRPTKTSTPKPATKPASTSLATLVAALAGKRARCDLVWFREPRTMAAKVFAWAKVSRGEKEDLLSDTFGDGIIEAFMDDEDGTRFRPFAVPFAYVGALPDPLPAPSKGRDPDWVGQPDGLLILDTRDGSVHLVHVDGTALVDDVKQVAPSIDRLGLQAIG